jgi:hypothetical protein
MLTDHGSARQCYHPPIRRSRSLLRDVDTLLTPLLTWKLTERPANMEYTIMTDITRSVADRWDPLD